MNERDEMRDPELQLLLLHLQRELFTLGLGCIALVVLAGTGRTFTYAYVGEVYGEEAERLRRRMLIAKHVLLFGAFAAGELWQYRLLFG